MGEVWVADLLSQPSGVWNETMLQQIFEAECTQIIQAEVVPPNENNMMRDRLIWAGDPSGSYSVKKGYRMLKGVPEGEDQCEELWNLIWKAQGLIPKVRMFIWRACQGALPTAQSLHRRINSISPMCARCQGENEYPTHLLFFCPTSRVVWHASDMTLRVEMLPIDIKECVLLLMRILPAEIWMKVANIMWCLWKVRNSEVLEGIVVRPLKVLMEAQAMATPVRSDTPSSRREQQLQPCEVPNRNVVLLVDGSWDTTGKARVAWVAYGNADMAEIVCAMPVKATTAFQAETMAVQLAILWFKHTGQCMGSGGVTIFTDCKVLITLLKAGSHTEVPSWHALENLLQIEKEIEVIQRPVEVEYM